MFSMVTDLILLASLLGLLLLCSACSYLFLSFCCPDEDSNNTTLQQQQQQHQQKYNNKKKLVKANGDLFRQHLLRQQHQQPQQELVGYNNLNLIGGVKNNGVFRSDDPEVTEVMHEEEERVEEVLLKTAEVDFVDGSYTMLLNNSCGAALVETTL